MNPAAKVALCHITGNGDYRLINVGAAAELAHIAHGDKFPDAPDGGCLPD